MEHRQKNEQSIFKISLGKADGLTHGEKLKIYSKQENINSLTNKTEIEEIEIAQAVASDLIQKNFAWIIVKDKEMAKKIKIGDFAIIFYKKRLF